MKYLLLILISSICFAKSHIVAFQIDTGTDISHVHEIRDYVNIANWEKDDYVDVNGHGTHVAGILLKNVCPQVELISCKYYEGKTDSSDKKLLNCFKTALKIRPDIINFSGGGPGYDQNEFNIIKQLSDAGIKIIVAAGNNGQDLSLKENEYYPAKYKGIKNLIVVGNEGAKNSNYGILGMIWRKGNYIYSTLPNGEWGYKSGTSMSTAIYSNELLQKICEEK